MSAGQQAAAGTMGGIRPKLPASITVLGQAASPGTATAALRINTSGDIEQQLNGGTVLDIGDWIAPKIGMSGYDAELVPISGTLSTGNVNTREVLSATRVYTVQKSGAPGTKVFTGTLNIRQVSVAGVLTSCPVSITAENT